MKQQQEFFDHALPTFMGSISREESRIEIGIVNEQTWEGKTPTVGELVWSFTGYIEEDGFEIATVYDTINRRYLNLVTAALKFNDAQTEESRLPSAEVLSSLKIFLHKAMPDQANEINKLFCKDYQEHIFHMKGNHARRGEEFEDNVEIDSVCESIFEAVENPDNKQEVDAALEKVFDAVAEKAAKMVEMRNKLAKSLVGDVLAKAEEVADASARAQAALEGAIQARNKYYNDQYNVAEEVADALARARVEAAEAAIEEAEKARAEAVEARIEVADKWSDIWAAEEWGGYYAEIAQERGISGVAETHAETAEINAEANDARWKSYSDMNSATKAVKEAKFELYMAELEVRIRARERAEAELAEQQIEAEAEAERAEAELAEEEAAEPLECGTKRLRKGLWSQDIQQKGKSDAKTFRIYRKAMNDNFADLSKKQIKAQMTAAKKYFEQYMGQHQVCGGQKEIEGTDNSMFEENECLTALSDWFTDNSGLLNKSLFDPANCAM